MPADTLHLDIVTAERQVYSDEVSAVVAPAAEGEITVLPNHAALLTLLRLGSLVIRKGSDETLMAIGGGFLEVANNRVLVLADSAERADEIDIARAEAAKRRAEERLLHQRGTIDAQRAEAALRRSLLRLRVAERQRRRGGGGPPRV